MLKHLQKLLLIALLCLPWVTQAQDSCQFKIVGEDGYADGWNGGSLTVMQGSTVVATFDAANADNDGYGPELDSMFVTLASDTPVSFVWASGDYDDEVTIWIYNSSNVLLFTVTQPSVGTIFSMGSPCTNCFAPGGLYVDSLTSDYARIAWSGTTDDYGIVWGESLDVVGGLGTETITSDDYYELTNLTAGTGYTFLIWSNCDNGETSDTVSIMFATIGNPITEYPYTTGFEAGDDIAWTFVNDATNKWFIGTGAARTDSTGLYISNDNGATCSYNTSGTQFSYAYRPFVVSDASQYSVSFDWKAYGETNYDYLRAWIAPATAQLTAGHDPEGGTSAYNYTTSTPAGWIDLGGKMNLQNTWQTTVATPNLTAGSYFLVFMWANDASGGSTPAAAIDNVYLDELTCPAPTNLAAVVTDDDVDITWVDPVGSAWDVFIGSMGDAPNVDDLQSASTNSFQVNDLETGFYDIYVRTDCGNDDHSFWVGPLSISVGVTVMNMATSGTDTLHSCAAIIYDDGGPSGSYSSSCQSTLIILPDNPGSNVVISGTSYTESTYDYLRIYDGVGTSGEELWNDYGVSATQTFGPFTSDAITVVFHSDGSVQYDGFEIHVACAVPSDCQRPSSFTATNVTPDSVYFEWIDSVGSNWTIAYGPAGTSMNSSNMTYVDFSDTYGAIGGLNPNTEYDFHLMTICGSNEGDTSWTRDLTVRTSCSFIGVLPWTQTFESAPSSSSTTGSAFVDCMTRLNNGTAYGGYPYVSSSSTYNHTPNGSKGLYWYNTSTMGTYGDYQIVVMPGIDFDSFEINNLQFKFWAKSSSSSYSPSFQVGVMTNPNDPNTFTQLASINIGNSTDWNEYTAALGAYEGTGHYIALRALRSTSSWYAYVDDFTIEPIPNCPPVTDLVVDGTTTSGAIAHWSYLDGVLDDAPDGYEIEYFEIGSTNAPVTINTTDQYITLSGLTPATDYKMYVRVDCGDGLGAADSVNFSTLGFGCAEIDTSMAFSDTIGNGTNTNSYLPSYSFYNYGMSQQIYTAAEIGHGGQIDQISFKMSAVSQQRTYEIYMGHVSVATATTYLNPSDLTCVYNGGAVTMTANQWTTFNLTTPFAYNGTDNLLVVFRDMTGSWVSGNSGYVHSAPSGAAMYSYQDSNPYTVGTGSGTTTTSRNNIILAGAPCSITATCAAPFVRLISNDSSSVTFQWIPGASETSWNIEYRIAGATSWTTAAQGVTATNYTINNLNPSEDYEVRVVTVCSDGEYAGTISFSTECGASVLPLTEDFQNGTGQFSRNCWRVGTTNLGTSYPYPTVVHLQGDDQNGLCLFYNGGYMVLPKVAAPLNQLQTRFTFIQGGDNVHFLMGLLPNQNDPIENIIVLDTIVRSEIDTTSATVNYTFSFAGIDPQYNGYNLAFWDAFNENYSFIDNFVMEFIPSCSPVTALSASNVTSTSADVSWSSTNTTASYLVEYGPRNFTPGTGVTMTTQNTNITLTGLTHSTNYDLYVYTLCGATDTSIASQVLQFSTLCDAISTLPYSVDFENIMPNGSSATNILPNCWASVAFSGTQPHTVWGSSATYYQSPTHSLYFYDQGVVALPAMTMPLNTLMVSFFDYNPSGDGMIIGAVDHIDSGFASTFTPIDTIAYTNGNNNAYQVTSFLNAYTGSYTHIAFKNYSNSGSYSTHYIDDVVIDVVPSCTPVSNLHVTGQTTSSITLDWGSYDPAASNWVVSYSTTPLTDPMQGTTTAVTAHPYTVNGLTPGTDYYFYVLNDCGAGDSSTWSTYGPVRPGVWNMRANQTDTVVMCGGTIYDDGGANGTYSGNQDSYIILRPSTLNALVSISGTSYTESSFDYLRIYDGEGTSGTELWNDYGVSSNQTLGPITSTTGSLTLYFHSDGSVYYDGFALDVSCISTSCLVTGLSLDANVPASSNSLALVWNDISAVKYQVAYGTPGFDVDNAVVYETTTPNYTITGLASLINYEVYVRGICSGSDTGSWSHVIFQTAMCDNVTIAENWDSTMNSTTSSYSPIGYALYNYSYVQTIIDSAYLATIGGDISAFSFNASNTTSSDYYTHMDVYMANVPESDLSSGFILPDSTTHVFVKVMNDATLNFTTSGEQLFSFDTTFTWDGHSNILFAVNRGHGSWSSSGSFSAHTATSSKMRYVYTDDNPYDYTTVSGGTASTSVGDIRFYSCGGGCASPVLLPVTDLSYNAATVNWNSNATDFEVAVKAATDAEYPAPTSVTGATSYAVTGLQPATTYRYHVRAICDATEDLISGWVEGTFTTDSLPCFVPTDLHTTDLGYTTATLAWTAGGIETMWNIHVWNTTKDTNFTATGNPYTVTGLAQTTSYYAAISALCGNGAVESEYSDTIQFTTATCAVPTAVTTGNITATTVTVSWNGSAQSYEIEYGDRNFNRGEGTKITVNGTTHQITGLESDHMYTLYVRAICEAGIMSDYSSQVDFDTPAGEGFDAVNGGMNVSIYPNPTTSATTIALSGVNGEVSITIVDMNGRIVMSDSMSCEGDCTKTMEVSGLAQGAYFVRLNGDNVNMVKKLVVK